jgi:HTH-type transcriptional regulator, sugar sensing transcriptional regulator
MGKIGDFLKELDLNNKEASIYLALLELGIQPASIIAKQVHLPRSTTAFHLESLAKKGFAEKSIKGKSNLFSPIQPTDIREILETKKAGLDHRINELNNLLPEFQNIVSQFLPQSKISYFEGVEGICKMIHLLLKHDVPLYFISAHSFHPEIQNYIQNVYVPRRKKMKSKCEMIITHHQTTEDYLDDASALYDWVGYLEKGDDHGINSTIVIFENKVEFMYGRGENPLGLLIENSYFAKSMMAIFNMLKHAGKIEIIKS